MPRKSLLIGVLLLCGLTLPLSSEAGERGDIWTGGYFGYYGGDGHAANPRFFGSYPNRYGHRYFRHYYFDYHYDEKSPYANLVMRPAGELQISVEPAHAQVFVDGYEVGKEDGLSYTIGLLTGAHSVKVIAEGYKAYQEEIRIEKGKKKSIIVKLTK